MAATVYELEQQLFAAFPAEHAQADDRIGLLVGSRHTEVKRIALGLDAKAATIEAAAAQGCNVLVTHHPVYWFAPAPLIKEGPSAGASMIRAIELEVALINMHTNLDSAPCAREMLLEPAGFSYTAPLSLPSETEEELRAFGRTIEITEGDKSALSESTAALGQLGRPIDGKPVCLREVVSRYKKTFGAVAKVWGNPDRAIGLLATCSGGGGILTQRVANTDADCYVTGEVSYHEALELVAAGKTLIELGHDRSELPYRFILYDALLSAGYEESLLHVLGPTASWWQ